MKVRNQKGLEKIEIPMTPMIDVVFQMLVFFIMTFNIVTPEGDFNIKMPIAAPSAGTPDPDVLPPIKVRLTADASGVLSSIQMGAKELSSFEELRGEVVSMLRGGSPDQKADYEVELDCDFDLHYDYVIDAITHCTGQRRSDGTIDRLVEKVKFAPPKKSS